MGRWASEEVHAVAREGGGALEVEQAVAYRGGPTPHPITCLQKGLVFESASRLLQPPSLTCYSPLSWPATVPRLDPLQHSSLTCYSIPP